MRTEIASLCLTAFAATLVPGCPKLLTGFDVKVEIVGLGTVRGDPDAFDCADDECIAAFDSSVSQVSITALAAPGWRFSHWEIIELSDENLAMFSAARPTQVLNISTDVQARQSLRLVFVTESFPDAGLPGPDGGMLETEPMLAAGNATTIARRPCDVAKGFGSNIESQLGFSGQYVDFPTPTELSWLARATHVDTSQKFSCALMVDGEIHCLGMGDKGQLGHGQFQMFADDPVTAFLIRPAVAVTTGTTHACALFGDGTVECWGTNGLGELGANMTSGDQHTPLPAEIEGVVQISAGTFATGALRLSDGAVFLWGNDGGSGMQAESGATHFPLPHLARLDWSGADTTPLTGALEVAVGAAHACARLPDKVLCWGDDDFGVNTGLLGDGPGVAPPTRMVEVGAIGVTLDLCVSPSHSCVVDEDGLVFCWGGNEGGQLGIGVIPASSPVAPLSQPGGFVEVACGNDHTCARRADGAIWCWGANDHGQLGAGFISFEPVPPFEVMPACP